MTPVHLARPTAAFRPVLLLLLAALFGCGGAEESACSLEHHCVQDGDGQVRCEDGFEWQDADDAHNYRCVRQRGADAAGDPNGSNPNGDPNDGDPLPVGDPAAPIGLRVERAWEASELDGIEADAGHMFVLVEVRLENRTDAGIPTSPLSFRLTTSDGLERGPSPYAGEVEGPCPVDAMLSSDQALTCALAFETPVDLDVLGLVYALPAANPVEVSAPIALFERCERCTDDGCTDVQNDLAHCGGCFQAAGLCVDGEALCEYEHETYGDGQCFNFTSSDCLQDPLEPSWGSYCSYDEVCADANCYALRTTTEAISCDEVCGGRPCTEMMGLPRLTYLHPDGHEVDFQAPCDLPGIPLETTEGQPLSFVKASCYCY